MQITIQDITPPTPANPEKGYPAGKNYKITSTDARKFLCNPDKRPSDLNVGMVVEIDTWADKFNNLYINRFTVINEDSVPPIPVPMTPTPQPIAPQQPQTRQQAPIAEAGGHDVAELVGRDWSIILQACVNRFASWTPDQKLQWFLINYSRGSTGAFKHLQQTEDLDNTAISKMPDDNIPF
jgi:hypothetical protein